MDQDHWRPSQEIQGSSSATPAARVIEEVAVTIPIPDPQPPAFDVSELVEIHDLAEEVEETNTSLISRRRKEIDAPAASKSQPPSVEEASPSTVVAKVLGNLASQEEVVESHFGVDGEAADT